MVGLLLVVPPPESFWGSQMCSVAGIDACYVILVSLDRLFSIQNLLAASLLGPKGLVPTR